MHKLRKFLVVLAFYMLCFAPLKGNHVAGGKLSYTHISGNKYAFTLTLVRDCNECEFNTGNCANITKLTIYDNAATPNVIGNLLLTFDSKQILSPTCKSVLNKCNGGSLPIGTENWIWKGTYDFTTLKDIGYCEFNVGIGIENRKPVYTANTELLFLKATLILCNSVTNSSPHFGSNFMTHIGVNNAISYNLVSTDLEDDSLVYTLVPALQSIDKSIDYGSLFTFKKPVSVLCSSCNFNAKIWPYEGIYLDSFTGLLTFTPNLTNNTVFCIEVKEYRKINGNQTLVGVTRQDMTVSVLNTLNNSTKLFFAKPSLNVCNKNTFAEEFFINDEEYNFVKDSVSVWLYSPLATTTFKTIRYKNHQFDGQYSFKSFIGKQNYTFIHLKSNDNNCPLTSTAYATSVIRFYDTPAIAEKVQFDGCNRIKAFNTLPLNNNVEHAFIIRDTQGNVDIEFGDTILFKTKVPGLHQIEHIVTNKKTNCESKAFYSVFVPKFSLISGIKPLVNSVCFNNTFIFKPIIIGGSKPYIFTWQDSILSDSFKVKWTAPTLLSLKIKDVNGCYFEFTKPITIKPKTTIIIKDTGICAINGPKLFLNEYVSWFPKTSQTLKMFKVQGNNTFTNFGFNFFTSTINPNNNVFKVVLTDNNFCTYTDTLKVETVEIPASTLLKNANFCENSNPINLQQSLKNTIYLAKWESTSLPIVKDSLIIPLGFVGNHNVTVSNNLRGCVFKYSTSLDILPIPLIKIKHPYIFNICETSKPFNLSYSPIGGKWIGEDDNNGFIKPNYRFNNKPKEKLYYEYTDISTGCFNKDSIILIVNKQAELLVDSVFTICELDTLVIPYSYKYSSSAIKATSTLSNLIINNNTITSVVNTPLDSITTTKINLQSIGNIGCPIINKSIIIKIKPAPLFQVSTNLMESCTPVYLGASAINLKPTVVPNSIFWELNDTVIKDKTIIKKVITKPKTHNILFKASKNGCNAKPIQINLNAYESILAKHTRSPINGLISQDFPQISFKSLSIGNDKYKENWNFIGSDNPFHTIPNPIAIYSKDTGWYYYTHSILTQNNCYNEETDSIYVQLKYHFYIPNAFSPNNNGPAKNETFKPIGTFLNSYTFTIYNKANHILFKTKDYNQGWDGTAFGNKVKPDTYQWQVEGLTPNGIRLKKNGYFILIR